MRVLPLLVFLLSTMLPVPPARAEAYSLYQSTDRQFSVSMEYPESWEVSQTVGSYNAYRQIMVCLPREEGKEGFAPGIILTCEDSSKVLFGAGTVSEYIAGIIEQRRRFPGFHELPQSVQQLFGEDGLAVDCSYQTPDCLHEREIRMITVRERIVVLRKGSHFYVLRYLCPDQDFDSHLSDFLHFAQSLRLNTPD